MSAIGLVLSLTAVACTKEGTPVTLGREVRLTLLHTADWHSRLFPYNQRVSATDASLGLQQAKAPFGGAARMNWLIQRERAHADRVLHLDSGDCFQGAPIFNFFGGEAEVRALNHTGVDAVVVGNHEFDRGAINFARQFTRWATFPVLASNYMLDDPSAVGSAELARLIKPYVMFNVRGLKVAVIGFGNLSSITSIFDQPNRTGITPINLRETAQFYVDQVQSQGADIVVGVSHVGLEDDHRMVERTTGFDVILGGHLHIVLNPSQELHDCQPFNSAGQHFVPQLDRYEDNPNVGAPVAPCDPTVDCCSADGVCAPEPLANPPRPYWRVARGYHERACSPRTIVLQHSGAFMKYLGRLDLVFSNDPTLIGEARLSGGTYDPLQRYEVVRHNFTLFPVDSSVPEEPTMARMLEPYARSLETQANLDNLIGYAPTGVSRSNVGGGDSPLGNLVTTSMWLRLGVQTDFALTNTLGIRDAIPPGPVSLDQVYNVFPFDNSITTMYLSGFEVREMFDFVARRSSSRGCNSQAQISGARVVVTCGGCDRNADGVTDHFGFDSNNWNGDLMAAELPACAETVNIGLQTQSITCQQDQDCNPPGTPPPAWVCRESRCVRPCMIDDDCNPPNTPPHARSLCEPRARQCMARLAENASYSLAANDFIAGGGSGFFILQRNTTQTNTFVQLRDAVVDYVQLRKPCGYDPAIARQFQQTHPEAPPRPDDGLTICENDTQCGMGQVCSCADRYQYDETSGLCTGTTNCGSESGRCVLAQCQVDSAALAASDCPEITTDDAALLRACSAAVAAGQPPPNGCADARIRQQNHDRCVCAAQTRGGELCRILSCFDESTGAAVDGRLRMRSVQ